MTRIFDLTLWTVAITWAVAGALKFSGVVA